MADMGNAGSGDVAKAQHLCSHTSFSEFPDSALDSSLVERFEQQVTTHRDCLAVYDRGRALTYGQLDAWANGIAHTLLDSRHDSELVALVLRQGAAYAASVLGTLKSGMGYVPLDPSEPPHRLAGFVAQAETDLILTDEETHAQAAPLVRAGDEPILVDALHHADAPPRAARADDIAYVFFTSGSTGTPKGVFDSHRNVLHNVLRYTNALKIGPEDGLTLLQGPAYSGCVSSLFCALLNGAASFPFRLDEAGLTQLAVWLREERITVYHSVPSIYRAVLAGEGVFPSVRVVRLEGDRASAFDVELLRRHFAPTCVLANGLGTTETGLARQLLVRPQDTIADGILPVGYPVRDVETLVVDDTGTPLPTGCVGEISVRSRYLALGYWRRPDLTAQVFTPDPVHGDGARRYRTGDVGRLLADGCLEYLGRRDSSVKVLGHRVEPAEVESELLALAGVREAAVSTRAGRRGEGRLVAYIVPAGGDAPSLVAVREALTERLPSYMLPTALVELAALPIGANGKIDRQALPEPTTASDAAPARDDLERRLVALWENILEVRPIGVDDNFFALGGDSLAAAEILAGVEIEAGRALPLSVLAGTPTIAGLAAELRAGRSHDSMSLAVLRSGGDRAPLVLVHGTTGHALYWADLVRHLDTDRPLWALEHLSVEDLRVVAIAARHVRTLIGAQPAGPYFLAGSCYGAVVAHEMARQLRTLGHEVGLLALLGFTPVDFPTMLTADASKRWSRANGPIPRLSSQVRQHLRQARALPTGERRRYLGRRGLNVLARTWHRAVGTLGGPVPARIAAQLAFNSHRPEPYPGRALLVLGADTTMEYTDDPARDWATLATEGVDVKILPGLDHAMLEEPGVADLAALLRARLASAL